MSTETKEIKTTPVETTPDLPVVSPLADIIEKEDSLVLLADMPGVDEKHVGLELEQGVLTITGEVTADDIPEAEITHWEFRPVRFQRSFTLSDKLDADQITASMKHGVLRLNLPKAEAAKPRSIEVRSG